jgi:hypothetical protein
MENIDKFNLCAAYVLNHLYGEFPERVLLKQELTEDIPGNDFDKPIDPSFLRHSIDWLAATGYLLGRERGTQTWNTTYVLSPKAFEAMAMPLPKALRASPQDSKLTIGEKLSQTFKEYGTQLGQNVIDGSQKHVASQIIKELIGFAAG